MRLFPHIKFVPYLTAILSLGLFEGCQVGPHYPQPEADIPIDWKHSPSSADLQTQEVCNWWDIFNDELLDTLMQEALANNHELSAAVERIFQARAMANIIRADLYPQLTLNPSYTNQTFLNRTYVSGLGNQAIPPFFRQHQLSYVFPLNLSWEIDLWGRIQNQYKSAVYAAQAQEEAYLDIMLVLTTDLADSYFRLRTLDKQIDLYQETIQTRKNALEINQARYDAMLSNYQPVSQAALDLSNVEADYYEALRQRDIQEDRIATLIGVPAPEFKITANPLRGNPPNVPIGLPSKVLLQRPDIAQAERLRASEHALIRSAYASFFPSFLLTGTLGFSSPDLKQFLTWKSRFWAIGASAAQTFLDGGRKAANFDLAIARFNEADQNYQQLVLTAFQEVEDALGSIEYFQREFEKLSQSSVFASTTYQIAFDRYLQGLTFYLEVMDSERDLLNAERNKNTIQGLRYTALIQLIKAMGGSWSIDD